MATDSKSKPAHDAPEAPLATVTTAKTLYDDPSDAEKAVQRDYLYWTERVTDTSLQLSFAVIAANWAVFGSIDGILKSFWSSFSVGLVIAGLGVSAIGAFVMGELHRNRIDYAEEDLSRWRNEYNHTAGKRDPWPFTSGIERLGRAMRLAKICIPVLAGVSFLFALLSR